MGPRAGWWCQHLWHQPSLQLLKTLGCWVLRPTVLHAETPCCSWNICLHTLRLCWSSFSLCPLLFYPLLYCNICYCWNHVSTCTLCSYWALTLFHHFKPLPLLPVCGSSVSAAAAVMFILSATPPPQWTWMCSTQALLGSARKWLGLGSADEHVCGLSHKFEAFWFGFEHKTGWQWLKHWNQTMVGILFKWRTVLRTLLSQLMNCHWFKCCTNYLKICCCRFCCYWWSCSMFLCHGAWEMYFIFFIPLQTALILYCELICVCSWRCLSCSINDILIKTYLSLVWYFVSRFLYVHLNAVYTHCCI